MTKVVTTHICDDKPVKTEFDIESNGFTLIVHQQGLKVEVPEFVEVDPQDTIRCMTEMSQAQWEWISESDVFKQLWKEAFDDAKLPDKTNLPKSIEVLNMADMGLRHVAGMIVLGCEACMAGRSVFFRNPETYLHPRTERCIATMLRKMLSLFNCSGKVKVKGYTRKDGTKVESYERAVTPKPADPTNDITQTLIWLQKLQDHYGPDKAIAEFGGVRKTVAEMMDEVNKNTAMGQSFVEEFVKARDGK